MEPAHRNAVRGFVRAAEDQAFNRYLLDLDLTDSRLAFLGLNGTRLRVPYVPTYDAVFHTVDLAGNVTPFESNERACLFAEDMPGEGREAYYFLGEACASPYSTRYDLLYSGPTCYIGGMPRWMQDPQWLECPKCDGRMTFLAHLENGVGVLIGGDQDAYIQMCANCLVVGVVMQQT